MSMSSKLVQQVMDDKFLIERIKAALATQEDGEALIEVARNAHKAELELASFIRRIENGLTVVASYSKIREGSLFQSKANSQ